MEQPFLYLRDNVVNGLNLLQSAVDLGIRRFILSSSANIFERPEQMPIAEDERIIPGSPYGESKFMLERNLHWLDRLRGLRYASLRYFNAAGASEERGEDHDPETHLIPLALQVALGQRQKLTIFGGDYETADGTCVRDYIHVLDLAEAHILTMRDLDRGSRVYNLGTGSGYSVMEVVEAARAITGHPIPVEIGPRRQGDPAVLIAGSEAIKRDLSWRPRHARLEALVSSAWRWHESHPTGY